MRTTFTNRVHVAALIPSLLSLVLGIGCMYYGYRYQQITVNSVEETQKIKEKIEASQCDASYKNASIALVHGNVKMIREYKQIYYEFGAVTVVIAVIGIAVIITTQRRKQSR